MLPNDRHAELVTPIVEQHIYHHSDNDKPKINVKVEKNSKGFNYEIGVTNATSVDEAITIMREAYNKIRLTVGETKLDLNSDVQHDTTP